MYRIIVSLIAAVMLSGCIGMSQKQNVYQTGQVQQAMKVKIATVIDVREVAIEAKPSGAGAMAGGAAGGLLAAGVDSRGGAVAGIAGAVAGGLAGTVAEKALSAKTGVEIVYQIDGSTEVEALVQEKDDQIITPGDRIRLIQGSFAVRAVKLAQGVAR